jgi:hypothetical protein
MDDFEPCPRSLRQAVRAAKDHADAVTGSHERKYYASDHNSDTSASSWTLAACFVAQLGDYCRCAGFIAFLRGRAIPFINDEAMAARAPSLTLPDDLCQFQSAVDADRIVQFTPGRPSMNSGAAIHLAHRFMCWARKGLAAVCW